METLFSRLSAYDILNSILPGAITYLSISYLLGLECQIQFSLYEKICIFYFLGLVIGRIASIWIEEFCKSIKLVVYADYKDYVYAESQDTKVSILSEKNNNYRNFLTVFVVIGALKCIKDWNLSNLIITWKIECWIIIAFIILFAWSYHKQTDYIRKRVEFICRDRKDK